MSDDEELAKDLGLLSALTIGIGTMIGAGIFVLPGVAAQEGGQGHQCRHCSSPGHAGGGGVAVQEQPFPTQGRVSGDITSRYVCMPQGRAELGSGIPARDLPKFQQGLCVDPKSRGRGADL